MEQFILQIQSVTVNVVDFLQKMESAAWLLDDTDDKCSLYYI
ncbi:hypothetical protein [Sphingobacterium sp. LRF_L2]